MNRQQLSSENARSLADTHCELVYIAWFLLLVALSSSVGNLVVLDLVRYLWWNMGIQLGGSQPRAGLAGKHSRDRTSLSQTSYLPK